MDNTNAMRAEVADPYGWTLDGIGCGRCLTYRMECEREDCPGGHRFSKYAAKVAARPTVIVHQPPRLEYDPRRRK